MVQRLFLLATLLLSVPFSISAQSDGEVYRFVIRDAESGEAIPNVISVSVDNNGKIVSNALTNTEGEVSLSSELRQIKLFRFSLLGYETKEIETQLIDTRQVSEVLLQFGNMRLQEIVVSVPPIRQKGDTLVYNAASFISTQDNYLDDLLKKLPGVSVSPSGVIHYQGKPINKFYIEGQDLLGNQYNQITRNLPVDAVSNVEVLENHQPVKVLRGKVLEEKAAMNIRLKESHKLRPIGELVAGLGGTPLVWDNRLFLTQIAKDNQHLMVVKMTNSGEDLSLDVAEQISIGGNPNYTLPPSPYLSITPLASSLPKHRWLENNAYTFGGNSLFRLGTAGSLRAKITGYLDKQSKKDYTTLYVNAPQPLEIAETRELSTHYRQVVSSLTYEFNEENTFFVDELKYKYSSSLQRGIITSNALAQKQNISDQYQYIENSLRTTLNIGKKMLDISSFTRYTWRRERLEIDNSLSNAFGFANRDFLTSNTLSWQLWRKGQHRLSLSTNAMYNYSHFEHYSGVVLSELRFVASPSYSYHFGSGCIGVSFPLDWNSSSLVFEDKAIEDSRLRFFALSPSLRLGYEINRWWAFEVNSSYNKRPYREAYYFNIPTMKGYRTRYEGAKELKASHQGSMGIGLKYKNLLKMLYANFSANYSRTKVPYIMDCTYAPELTTMSFIHVPHNKHFVYASLSLDKTFAQAMVTLKTNISYNGSKFVISQNKSLVDNQSNMLNYTFDANFAKISWIKVHYMLGGAVFWRQNKLGTSKPINLFANELKLLFPFTSRINASVSYQHKANQQPQGHYLHAHFADTEVNYKPNKHWGISILLNNIFNNDHYQLFSQSGLNGSYYSLPLRGRELMVKFKRSF